MVARDRVDIIACLRLAGKHVRDDEGRAALRRNPYQGERPVDTDRVGVEAAQFLAGGDAGSAARAGGFEENEAAVRTDGADGADTASR